MRWVARRGTAVGHRAVRFLFVVADRVQPRIRDNKQVNDQPADGNYASQQPQLNPVLSLKISVVDEIGLPERTVA
jgi:hypothetical protein